MSFNLKEIKKLTWDDVFQIWQDNEGENPNWDKLAKERGFASWADWRLNAYAIPFLMPEADWNLFEVENPAEFIRNSYGGPFSSWQKKFYNGARYLSFAELAKLKELQAHLGVQNLMANYPEETIILIVELNDGRRIVLEGMHRSSALAIMAEKGLASPKKLQFAIGKLDLAELGEHKVNKSN